MKLYISICFFLFNTAIIFPQSDNIPLNNGVYNFLKNMSVKKIVVSIKDADPNLSGKEVKSFLEKINESRVLLSSTEKKLLDKYRIEFIPELRNESNTDILLSGGKISSVFSEKKKYSYYWKKNDNNVYFSLRGNLFYGTRLNKNVNNAWLFDAGFRAFGTFLGKLGYNFEFTKGGKIGDDKLSVFMLPELRANFKFNEKLENLQNYDFTGAYMRLDIEPSDDIKMMLQIGRETQKLGYGFTDRLTLSGNIPNMDFIKFRFSYGIFNLTSLHISTVGKFSNDMNERYTKFVAANRVSFSFENLFDIGLGEAVVYSGRGIEIGYILPFAFYKFQEISLQDRDNGVFFADIQTHFLKNFQIQASLFFDESPIVNLFDMEKSNNKTAYQIGFFFYEPLGISDIFLIAEYTKIRPYVYSHINPKNTFTAYGLPLGSGIGPNADRIFARITYNFSENLSFSAEFSHIRKGNNIKDTDGNLLFNAGGDFEQPFREGIDNDKAIFLDGDRINFDNVILEISYEPFRDIIFNLIYRYEKELRLKNNSASGESMAFFRFNFDF